jgi:hypothetical protein
MGEVSPKPPLWPAEPAEGNADTGNGQLGTGLGTPSDTPTASDTAPDTRPTSARAKRAFTRKPREPDPLFDAVAEVTASDANASGAHIGRVCKALRNADPPYTAEEVRRWAEIVRREWGLEHYPTLGMVEKHIGRVRAKPLPATAPNGAHHAKRERNGGDNGVYDPARDPFAR